MTPFFIASKSYERSAHGHLHNLISFESESSGSKRGMGSSFDPFLGHFCCRWFVSMGYLRDMDTDIRAATSSGQVSSRTCDITSTVMTCSILDLTLVHRKRACFGHMSGKDIGREKHNQWGNRRGMSCHEVS